MMSASFVLLFDLTHAPNIQAGFACDEKRLRCCCPLATSNCSTARVRLLDRTMMKFECPWLVSNQQPTDYAYHYSFRRPRRIFDFRFLICDLKSGLKTFQIKHEQPSLIKNRKSKIKNALGFVVWTFSLLYASAIKSLHLPHRRAVGLGSGLPSRFRDLGFPEFDRFYKRT